MVQIIKSYRQCLNVWLCVKNEMEHKKLLIKYTDKSNEKSVNVLKS